MRATPILIACALIFVLAGRAQCRFYQTGPLPSEFGGGILPFHPPTLPNLQFARAAMSKLRVAVEKCYSKGVRNYVNGKASGVAACLDDPAKGALAKYAATIANLRAKPGTLPACFPFEQMCGMIAENTRALHEWDYCGAPPGSPSGAFLDGDNRW